MSYSNFEPFIESKKPGQAKHSLEQDARTFQMILFHFFYSLGAMHISSTILAAKYPQEKFFTAISQVLDLPFFMILLAYGGIKLSFLLNESLKNFEKSLKIAGVLCVFLSLILIALNFLVPDKAIL